jgi:hypothetical protein
MEYVPLSKYTHLELNSDILAPSGYYTPQKEVRLKYDGREVLYTISRTVIECSCCGATSYNSALVPGYIVRWQTEKDEEGSPVSEVEPVTSEKARDDISKIIKETEHVSQTEFW